MAARQPRPVATVSPTTKGAMVPMPAATAFASVMAEAPALPWWSLSTAATGTTTNDPPKAPSMAPVSVRASTSVAT